VRTSQLPTSLQGKSDRVYDNAWLMDLEEGVKLRIAECYHESNHINKIDMKVSKKENETDGSDPAIEQESSDFSFAGLVCHHPTIIGITAGSPQSGRCSYPYVKGMHNATHYSA